MSGNKAATSCIFVAALLPLFSWWPAEAATERQHVATSESVILNAPARYKNPFALFAGLLWVTDAHVDGIDDGDAAGEFVEVGAPDKIGNEGVDGEGAQGERAEQNDAGMGAGRILAQVGELDVESQQHALFMLGGACDFGVGPGKQILVGRRQDIVTEFNQYRFEMAGEVLVQLELHSRVPVFQTLS